MLLSKTHGKVIKDEVCRPIEGNRKVCHRRLLKPALGRNVDFLLRDGGGGGSGMARVLAQRMTPRVAPDPPEKKDETPVVIPPVNIPDLPEPGLPKPKKVDDDVPQPEPEPEPEGGDLPEGMESILNQPPVEPVYPPPRDFPVDVNDLPDPVRLNDPIAVPRPDGDLPPTEIRPGGRADRPPATPEGEVTEPIAQEAREGAVLQRGILPQRPSSALRPIDETADALGRLERSQARLGELQAEGSRILGRIQPRVAPMRSTYGQIVHRGRDFTRGIGGRSTEMTPEQWTREIESQVTRSGSVFRQASQAPPGLRGRLNPQEFSDFPEPAPVTAEQVAEPLAETAVEPTIGGAAAAGDVAAGVGEAAGIGEAAEDIAEIGAVALL